MRTWHILTGEFPPQAGGVSDYSGQVATSLARQGDEVHVWTTAGDLPSGELPLAPRLTLHRLREGFSPSGIYELSAKLSSLPPGGRILVQYVPSAFGYRGMNVAFCAWLLSRRRERVWVMFHEVAHPFGEGRRRTNVLAGVNSLMAGMLIARADCVLSSTSAWIPRLRLLSLRKLPVHVVPIPSALPTHVETSEIATTRSRLAPASTTTLVGHFGSYGQLIREEIESIVPSVLEHHPEVGFALLGGGSGQCLTSLQQRLPRALADRLVAPAEADARAVAASLAACDLLVQPYPDGVTTRRSSMMAGLALGRPIVTNRGRLTEPEWEQLGAASLADNTSATSITEELSRLLRSAEARDALGERASQVYRARFSLEHSLRVMRDVAMTEG